MATDRERSHKNWGPTINQLLIRLMKFLSLDLIQNRMYKTLATDGGQDQGREVSQKWGPTINQLPIRPDQQLSTVHCSAAEGLVSTFAML